MAIPPIVTVDMPPNVVIMLDNSGSMKKMMYGSSFADEESYYGMFQSGSRYRYDPSVEVDDTKYDGDEDDPYDVTLDTSKTGSFVQDQTCEFGAGENCWDGDFLNWMTMRKIDVARMVLIGGKTENRDGVDTNGDGVADYWKIVGNNEYRDGTLTRSNSYSQTKTPFTWETTFTVESPARGGVSHWYFAPYAKLQPGSSIPLLAWQEEDDGEGGTVLKKTVVGEMGYTGKFNNEFDSEDYQVVFDHDFSSGPVLTVGPMVTKQEGLALRVDKLDENGFEIRTKGFSAEYTNKISAYYIALEPGSHQLVDGPLIHAGTVENVTDEWTTVSIEPEGDVGDFGEKAPIVLPLATSNGNSGVAVNIRLKNITGNDMALRLDPGDTTTLEEGENVDFMAIEQGSWDMSAWKIAVGLDEVEDEKDFTDFTHNIRDGYKLAHLQTTNDDDPAGLIFSHTLSSAQATEGKMVISPSGDSGSEHQPEDVGYVHITSALNLAVKVDEEPTGLLHQVYEDVRLGLSFYNYDYKSSSNIYKGNVLDGGTLQLVMPRNPFIREPWVDDDGKTPGDDDADAQAEADAKFRTVDTYVRGNPYDPDEGEQGLLNIIDGIEHYPVVWGTTPLAENMVEVGNYFRQDKEPEYPEEYAYPDYAPYQVNTVRDPFVVGSGTEPVECLSSYLLVFTDGEPELDGCVDDKYIDYDNDDDGNDAALCGGSTAGSDGKGVMDDVAAYFQDHDLRDDIDGDQLLTVYTVGFGSDEITSILEQTAENGGGAAYAAEEGFALTEVLADSFARMKNNALSGTGVGVVSRTGSGTGAVFQAVFYPERDGVDWVGDVRGLLVDQYGNLREDTDSDHALDSTNDRIVEFNDDGTVNLYTDPDGDSEHELDCAYAPEDCDEYCSDDDKAECAECGIDSEDAGFLWQASTWLNHIDLDPITQRSDEELVTGYDTNSSRYLFTFVDTNQDMVVDDGEQIAFSCDGCQDDDIYNIPDESDLTDTTKVFPYLTLYPSVTGTGEPDSPWTFSSDISAMMQADNDIFTNYQRLQAGRLISFIRGEDQDTEGITVITSDGNYQVVGEDDELVSDNDTYTIAEFRKRQTGEEGITWRLGDVVYSTPTFVGTPAEAYHLLYSDATYGAFAERYQYRRGVVYVGGNDGIFHAFNAGFFREEYTDGEETVTDKFWKYCSTKDDGALVCKDEEDTGYLEYLDLGAELWGYIPHNLLPHLFWLTDTDYDAAHVYYADLKPRVFDAKIFEEEQQCADYGRDNGECIHPYGWGTVLVGGMRLGGGEIRVDMDKADNDSFTTYQEGVDRTMRSSYFVLDVTNPEKPPELLAEFSFEHLGYTTSYPTPVPMRNMASDDNDSVDENEWYLVFGSGPDDLEEAKSTRTGKLYVVDLNELGKDVGERKLVTYNQQDDGEYVIGDNDDAYLAEYEADSFISNPVAVDYNLDFRADAVYFGSVIGDEEAGWGGRMRRVVTGAYTDPDYNYDPTSWNNGWTAGDNDSVLLDLSAVDIDGDGNTEGQPITAAPAIGLDEDGYFWIFFGTGRYFTEADEDDFSRQSYYGIKEPVDNDEFSWAEVVRSDLYDVSNVVVYVDDYMDDTDDLGIDEYLQANYDDLLDAVADAPGWRLDFTESGERNLGQAALYGEVLSFTTYVPPADNDDPCEVFGTSWLYGTNFVTGTAFTEYVFHQDETAEILEKVEIGSGAAAGPSVHVGEDGDVTIIMPTSTGAIQVEEEQTPGETTSGRTYWLQRN